MTRTFGGFMMATAILTSAAAGPARGADKPIVFINLDRAFNEFYKTKLADSQLKQQADEITEERKALVADYEKLREAFNAAREAAQNPVLNEEARREKLDEAENKRLEMSEQEARIRRFDETRRKQLDDQSRRMRKRIVDEILEVIRDYGRTEGVWAVVDSSAQSLNGVECVLYSDAKGDVTNIILDRLNKGRMETGEAAESKPASRSR